ncbi:MAG: LysM peptidoglycan-binding domain-containing protein, partial [Geminicoccaceae bacterium]|nr:LysM peptidoglycan-binding domain-containing protein [Geminicoccaceae bacterium]
MSRLGAALALIGLFGAPAGAADWLYTVRPGDHLWNLAQRYLNDRGRWLELGRYNGLPDPDRLEPGTTLKIPVAWLRIRPAPARLAAVRGPVRIYAADGGERPAVAGLLLEGGERLVSGPEGSALVRFADGSELEIHPDCEVVFDRLAAYGRAGMVDTRLRLERGRLRARVPAGTGGYGVDTPAATPADRGTAFRN